MVLWLRKRQQKNGLVNSISREAQEGIIPRETEKPAGGYLTTAPEAMESLTLHLALIGFLYLIAFSGTNQLSAWLAQFGNVGQLLGEFLWSYNFLIGLLLGYLGRIVINWLELGYLFDSGTMQRISGAMVDYMITAALAAVPLLIYVDYWPEAVSYTHLEELAPLVEQVIAENPDAVENYRKGKKKALAFLVGKVMALTRGRADPQELNRLFEEKI